MGLLERFNERFPAASSKGKDAIAWVRDSCETLADAYDARRELNAIKKDPVGYYRNMVRANAENIANVDISKIPHSVYKELAIIAVSKNPNNYLLLKGPILNDEAVLKTAMVSSASTYIPEGRKQHFNKFMASQSFPAEHRNFDAAAYLSSHGDSLEASHNALIEEDKAKSQEEVAESPQVEDVQGTSKKTSSIREFVERAKKKKVELDSAVVEINKVAKQVEAEAAMQATDNSATQQASGKNKRTFAQALKKLGAMASSIVAGLTVTLASNLEMAPITSEADKMSVVQVGPESATLKNANQTKLADDLVIDVDSLDADKARVIETSVIEEEVSLDKGERADVSTMEKIVADATKTNTTNAAQKSAVDKALDESSIKSDAPKTTAVSSVEIEQARAQTGFESEGVTVNTNFVEAAEIQFDEPTEVVQVEKNEGPKIFSYAVRKFYAAFGDLQKVVGSGSKNNQKFSINKIKANLENDFNNGKYTEKEFSDLTAFLDLAAEEKVLNESGKNVTGRELMSRILTDKELKEVGVQMGG